MNGPPMPPIPCPHCRSGSISLTTEYYGVGGTLLILLGLGVGTIFGLIFIVIGVFQFGSRQFEVCSSTWACGYKKRLS